MKNWEDGFVKHHPGIIFKDKLPATSVAIGGLCTGVADMGILGREIWPIELIAFNKTFSYDPLEIMVATGTFDVDGETWAQAILIHKDNPLTKLTMKQLDGIFGSKRTGGFNGVKWNPAISRGADENIRTWGQLGLKGAWSDKPIHVYGYPLKLGGFSFFFSERVFGGGDKWNEDLVEFGNIEKPDGTKLSSTKQIVEALSKDPYGIAYSVISSKTPQLKSVALAAKDGGPYIEMTRENVQNRTYPLTRSVYIYVNRSPGAPLDPKVKEFLRYILSREGQQGVSRESKYLPLTAELVREQ